MTEYKLTYFDFSGSRGEECRLALHVAGVEFQDNRITQEQWAALKPSSPYGALPILETPGKLMLAQSNPILAYVGRLYDLHPKDAWEAARHEAILESVEEVRVALGPSGKLTDADERKRAREALASGYLQTWGANMERQIQGRFVAGAKIQVADIKLFQILSSLTKGVIDHIPTTVFSAFPKLTGVYAAVLAHPKVADWRSKH
jgi:glutathione S-transferase